MAGILWVSPVGQLGRDSGDVRGGVVAGRETGHAAARPNVVYRPRIGGDLQVAALFDGPRNLAAVRPARLLSLPRIETAEADRSVGA